MGRGLRESVVHGPRTSSVCHWAPRAYFLKMYRTECNQYLFYQIQRFSSSAWLNEPFWITFGSRKYLNANGVDFFPAFLNIAQNKNACVKMILLEDFSLYLEQSSLLGFHFSAYSKITIHPHFWSVIWQNLYMRNVLAIIPALWTNQITGIFIFVTVRQNKFTQQTICIVAVITLQRGFIHRESIMWQHDIRDKIKEWEKWKRKTSKRRKEIIKRKTVTYWK